jgi:hypothetical protein
MEVINKFRAWNPKKISVLCMLDKKKNFFYIYNAIKLLYIENIYICVNAHEVILKNNKI